jgi:anti-anti-sigma factor
LSLADVRFSAHGRALVASVVGEVDLSNADNIRAAITESTDNHCLVVVLDLSDLDYLDSSGIQLIYQLREDVRARGQALRLVIPAGSPVNDALRLAGVAAHLETIDSVEEALRDLG